MIKLPLVDRITFLVERQFVKGAGFQLLFVAAAIGLISLVGGVAVRVSGTEGSLGESIWWAFLRLTDPGYLGDDEGTWRRVVSTILTVSGYVVFLGALVAIMTQWLIARMREFERGLTPVALSNHVVIIGWTNRTIPLLQELVGSDRSERRFLTTFATRRIRPVILSEEVSAIQAQELRSDPILGRSARRIILRYGSALEEEAIRRAACLNAAAVIMPSDFRAGSELVHADVETIRALLSIDARAEQFGETPPLVIAEVQDARRTEMMRRAYRGPLEIVPSDETVSRLLAQNLLHPGLSAFFRETLTALEGNEFHLRPAGAMAGVTLAQFASRCPRAIVLGVLRPAHGTLAPMLNAPPAETIRADDLLVLLARRVSDTISTGEVGSRPSVPSTPPASRQPLPSPSSHRVLMLGWSQRVPNLVHELSSYPDARIEIDLVSTAEASMRRREIERYAEGTDRVTIRHIEADYLLTGELERLRADQYSAIFLLTSDRLESIEEADARAVVGYRIIEGLLEGRPTRPQIILELADAANEGLVRNANCETLVSPMVISHVLAQVTLHRTLKVVFDELFTAGGAELEFRAAEPYGVRDSMTFDEMEALVRSQGDTLLGLQRSRTPPTQPTLLLNPERGIPVRLAERDRLCVLTTVS